MNISFFARTLRRLRRAEGGFSLIETIVALGVLFVSLLVLAHTAAIGFTDIAMSRQRQQANQLANKMLEQVRGLTYARVGQGLQTSDLTGDTNIVLACPDGASYYLECPASNPNAEKIVHSLAPAADVPLVPHRRTFGTTEGYTTTYTASVYVTAAKMVPSAGAYRVTALVSWSPAARGGVKSYVTTQSLLYTPEGTTDATTGGGTAPFFYGTGSIGRAPITLTPNAGVSGGTGVAGLPSWDSMTEDLYGLEASVQQQSLVRTESKVALTGANTVISGVETIAGGDTAEAVADNDPATPPTTSSAPGSLMQSAVSSSVSGGGNSVDVVAASGGGGIPCPSAQPNIKWMSGFEHGRGFSAQVSGNGGGGFFYSAAGNVSIDSAVKRTGNYSLKAAPAANLTYEYFIGPTTNRVSVMHFAIRLASLPSTDTTFAYSQISTSSSYAVAFGYQASSNKFRVRLRNGANVWQAPVTSATTVTAGQWYAIDLKWDTTTTTHTAAWQVDAVAQTQASLTGAAAVNQYLYLLGTDVAATYTANYDDVLVSYTAADYPIPDGGIKALVPDGMGTSNIGLALYNESGTQTDLATWWQKLDEIPAGSALDYIYQALAVDSRYAEFTLQDTTDTCIRAVEAVLFAYGTGASTTNNGQLHVMDGTTDRTAWNGNLGSNFTDGTFNGMGGIVAPAVSPWTQAAVNGLKLRVGYSNDVDPIPAWMSLTVQYYSPTSGEQTEGGAGTETGSTASTTAASAGTPCGTPTQIDGRACSYAAENYSTTGPPHLSARLNLTGSSLGTAKVYKFSPTTQAGSTSYVWGRRTAGTGGAGTVKESVVRYPGTHEFAALPFGLGSGPAGWAGYWVKLDAGSSAASVSAEAGIGSAAPSYTSAGTISYWNGTGYSSMAPPAAGGSIPVTAVDYTSGGYRIEISGSLASSPSFTSQVPTGASGTADRNEARATLGSPVSGTFTYKITNTGTSAVICDLTIAVDLGALTATARYAP